MLHQYQSYADDIRSDLYSKYQCQDRKSSASSTASTASSGSNHSFSQKFTQVSRLVLANALQKNWNDNFANQTGYDESLTNLNWLHLSFSPFIGYPKDRVNDQICQPRNFQTYPNQHWPHVPSSTRLPMSHEMATGDQPDYKHNPNLKPSFSYAILISWAMKELGKPKITLSDIYSWIMENFAYYRHADSSWQNSIRHNLSLGKCFEKVPRRKDEPGKGGFWRINPQHSRTLDMNLSKIKYNPFHRELQSTKSDNVFTMPRLKNDNIHLSSSTSTPIKRSRKSPLTVTEEDWDSQEMYNDEYHSNESMTFDDSPNINNQGCYDLSPFDNSSSDSNNLGPPSDNDISMNNFDDDSLDYILNSPMLLNKEDTFNNDEFRLQLSNNDLSDFFLSSKDDLQELDCLLGIF